MATKRIRQTAPAQPRWVNITYTVLLGVAALITAYLVYLAMTHR